MISYHHVGKVGDFREEKIRRFFRGGREIAVVLYQDRFYAFSNRCTHNDFQMHFGFVEDGCLWCPIHYGVYDLPTGKAVSGPVTDLPVYPVRVEGEDVLVGLEEPPEPASEPWLSERCL